MTKVNEIKDVSRFRVACFGVFKIMFFRPPFESIEI